MVMQPPIEIRDVPGISACGLRSPPKDQYVIDIEARKHLDSLELKLSQLQESQVSQMAVNDLIRTISARAGDSVRQSEECEQSFKEAMHKFAFFDQRVCSLESALRTQIEQADRQSYASESKFRNMTEDVSIQAAQLDEVRQALLLEKAENAKVNRALQDQLQHLCDVIPPICNAQTATQNDVQSTISMCTELRECADKLAADFRMTEATVADQQKMLSSRTDGISEDLEKQTEKMRRMIGLLRDDMSAMLVETKKEVSQSLHVSNDVEKQLKLQIEHRTQHVQEIHDGKLARHASTFEEKIDTLSSVVTQKFDTMTDLAQQTFKYVNDVAGKMLDECDDRSARQREMLEDYVKLEIQRLVDQTSQITEVSSDNCLRASQLVGAETSDQISVFTRMLDRVEKKVNDQYSDILEKAKLAAMDLSDLRAVQCQRKLARDIDIVVYWLQTCCDRLHLHPKGSLALPKRSSSPDTRRESPVRGAVSRLTDSSRRSFRVGESPRRSVRSASNGRTISEAECVAKDQPRDGKHRNRLTESA